MNRTSTKNFIENVYVKSYRENFYIHSRGFDTVLSVQCMLIVRHKMCISAFLRYAKIFLTPNFFPNPKVKIKHFIGSIRYFYKETVFNRKITKFYTFPCSTFQMGVTRKITNPSEMKFLLLCFIVDTLIINNKSVQKWFFWAGDNVKLVPLSTPLALPHQSRVPPYPKHMYTTKYSQFKIPDVPCLSFKLAFRVGIGTDFWSKYPRFGVTSLI